MILIFKEKNGTIAWCSISWNIWKWNGKNKLAYWSFEKEIKTRIINEFWKEKG